MAKSRDALLASRSRPVVSGAMGASAVAAKADALYAQRAASPAA